MRNLILLGLVLAVGGCSVAATKMNSYIGGPIQMAVADYGRPHDTFDMPDGSKAYQWYFVRGGKYSERGQKSCRYTLYTDSRGVVTGYRDPVLGC